MFDISTHYISKTLRPTDISYTGPAQTTIVVNYEVSAFPSQENVRLRERECDLHPLITFKRRVAFSGWHCQQSQNDIWASHLLAANPFWVARACMCAAGELTLKLLLLLPAGFVGKWLLAFGPSACAFLLITSTDSHARFVEINLGCGSFAPGVGVQRHRARIFWPAIENRPLLRSDRENCWWRSFKAALRR